MVRQIATKTAGATDPDSVANSVATSGQPSSLTRKVTGRDRPPRRSCLEPRGPAEGFARYPDATFPLLQNSTVSAMAVKILN
jgi:hypothetical protein